MWSHIKQIASRARFWICLAYRIAWMQSLPFQCNFSELLKHYKNCVFIRYQLFADSIHQPNQLKLKRAPKIAYKTLIILPDLYKISMQCSMNIGSQLFKI